MITSSVLCIARPSLLTYIVADLIHRKIFEQFEFAQRSQSEEDVIERTDLQGNSTASTRRQRTHGSRTDLLDRDFLSIFPPDGTNDDSIGALADDILNLVIDSDRKLDFARLGLRRLRRRRACRALLLDVGLRHGC